MASAIEKPMCIPVGFQWRNKTGKEWLVTGILPGGVCTIHQVGRFVSGQVYARDLRRQIADGSSVPLELTDEARKILRRING